MLNYVIISNYDANLESNVGEAAFATRSEGVDWLMLNVRYAGTTKQRLIMNNEYMTDLKSIVGEAASATRREGVVRPTSSKGSRNNEAYD